MLTLASNISHSTISFMSYLIQNLQQSHPSIRINLRVRTAFLARNIHVIYTLLTTGSLPWLFHKFTRSFSIHTALRFKHLFSKSARVLLPKPKFLRFVPMGVNFPNSAYYKTITGIERLVTGYRCTTELHSIPKHRIKYPYFTPHKVAITPVTNRAVFKALYKFLHMSLNLWCVWPRLYNLTAHFTPIGGNLLLVKFLSKYFFKVYSI